MTEERYYCEHVGAWLREQKRLSYFKTGEQMAAIWASWCGDTAWTRAALEFGALGGRFKYYDGMPRSKSAIPLTFALLAPDGTELPSNSRLKDIRAAIATLKARQGEAA